jgi:ribosomal protein L36
MIRTIGDKGRHDAGQVLRRRGRVVVLQPTLTPDGLRTCLQERQRLRFRQIRVQRPLDVLGAAIVPLHLLGEAGDGDNLVVRETRRGGSGVIDGGPHDAAGVPEAVLMLLPRDHRPGDRQQHLVHEEAVGCHLAGDDCLAETPGSVDGDGRPVAV